MPRKKKSDKPEKVEKAEEELYYKGISLEKQKETIKFIESIIQKNIKSGSQKNSDRLSDYSNLVAINSEWLESFFIIGYNLKGEEVVITKALTTKDYNALLSILKKAFINFVVKSEIG